MTSVNFLFDDIHKDKGIVPNLNSVFGVPDEFVKNTFLNLNTFFSLFDKTDLNILPSYLGSDTSGWIYPILIDRPLWFADDLLVGSEHNKMHHFWWKLPKKVRQGIEQKRGWVLLYCYEPLSHEFLHNFLYPSISDQTDTHKQSNLIPFNRFLIVSPNHVSHDRFVPLVDLNKINVLILDEHEEEQFQTTIFKERRAFVNFNYHWREDFVRQTVNRALVSLFSEVAHLSSEHYLSIQQVHWSDIIFVTESIPYRINSTAMREEKTSQLITEKTWRCFFYKKPFIMFGYRNILKDIHSLGYKTFSDWWNESYDDTEDTNERMKQVFKQLMLWSNRSVQDRDAILKEMQEITEHNYQVFMSSIDKDRQRDLLLAFQSNCN